MLAQAIPQLRDEGQALRRRHAGNLSWRENFHVLRVRKLLDQGNRQSFFQPLVSSAFLAGGAVPVASRRRELEDLILQGLRA